jgi:hypothetical protein
MKRLRFFMGLLFLVVLFGTGLAFPQEGETSEDYLIHLPFDSLDPLVGVSGDCGRNQSFCYPLFLNHNSSLGLIHIWQGEGHRCSRKKNQ